MRSLGFFQVKRFFIEKKDFFTYHILFFQTIFLFTTSELIISINSCENDFLKIIFCYFSSFIFSCLSCVSPFIRSLGLFDVKTTFIEKKIVGFSDFVFYYLSCVLPLKRSLKKFYVKTLFKRIFFQTLGFLFSCLPCVSPLIRSLVFSFFVKSVFQKNMYFFNSQIFFFCIFPVCYHWNNLKDSFMSQKGKRKTVFLILGFLSCLLV